LIVSKKLLIAAAVIPIIIALAIAIPKISPGNQTANTPLDMRISFVKEDMKRISFGVTENIGSQKSETLIINNDAIAFYTLSVEGEKGSQTKFQVDEQELKRIRALITETGFMQIPKEQFEPRDNVTEFTRYTLTASFGSSTKTVQWVDESSSKDTVPALLTMIRDTLLETVKERN
jgi:hypothetical protein